MNNLQRTFNRKLSSSALRILGSFAFLLSLFLAFGFDTQHDDGIAGATKKNGSGCICHSFTSDDAVSITLSGPASVAAGSNTLYTIQISGGPAMTGGFNVAAFQGALGASQAGTKILSGEITHTTPKAFSAGSVSWQFSYQAPASAGSDTLYTAGLSSNNDFTPTSADHWNFGTNFPITITANPSAISTLSEWGKIILAAMILFSLVLLVRRRSLLSSSCADL